MSKEALAELEEYTPADPVLPRALERAWSIIAQSEVADRLDGVELNVFNPAVASRALQTSGYSTNNCLALRAEKRLIVNEMFLLELEAAVRSFAQAESLMGSPYLKSDEQLFGLVRRIQLDRAGYLTLLRKRGTRRAATAENTEIEWELALLIAFFLSHEAGHLLGGHPAGSFGAFVDEALPLEDRFDEAVVKLCRHMDEFVEAEFGLSGFQEVANPTQKVRQAADKLRRRQEKRFERQEAFFKNEADADEWANRILIGYLTKEKAHDPVGAEHSLYLLSRGVFVAALFSWYRDLSVFGSKLGVGGISHSNDLTMAMVRSREMYIYAASLFGEHHRFTLLRGVLLLEAVLRGCTPFRKLPDDARLMWSMHDDVALAASVDARREWWLAESIQRYTLLAILMDTAVKLSHVGCSTGWIRETDAERGTPQLLLMHFEPIDVAVQRLRGER